MNGISNGKSADGKSPKTHKGLNTSVVMTD